MISACRHPVLIIEGPGDEAAVPLLLRKIAHEHGIYDFNPCSHPIQGPNLPKLAVDGMLERFVGYAQSRSDGDSVLVCVDTDGACPKTNVENLARRLKAMHLTKKVGLCFFHCEFEAMAITCLDLVSARFPEFGWRMEDWTGDIAAEDIRGAKGYLTRHMRKGKAYKETRDQVRFVEKLDMSRLRLKSRAFQHLEKTWKWLVDMDAQGGTGLIAPLPGPV